jgi:hypothetical protein
MGLLEGHAVSEQELEVVATQEGVYEWVTTHSVHQLAVVVANWVTEVGDEMKERFTRLREDVDNLQAYMQLFKVPESYWEEHKQKREDGLVFDITMWPKGKAELQLFRQLFLILGEDGKIRDLRPMKEGQP